MLVTIGQPSPGLQAGLLVNSTVFLLGIKVLLKGGGARTRRCASVPCQLRFLCMTLVRPCFILQAIILQAFCMGFGQVSLQQGSCIHGRWALQCIRLLVLAAICLSACTSFLALRCASLLRLLEKPFFQHSQTGAPRIGRSETRKHAL